MFQIFILIFGSKNLLIFFNALLPISGLEVKTYIKINKDYRGENLLKDSQNMGRESDKQVPPHIHSYGRGVCRQNYTQLSK